MKWVSEAKGYGAFASRGISKGEFIGCYTGEVVDEGWLIRHKSQHSRYLFKVSTSLYVDGTQLGNLTRYVNHADDESTESNECLLNAKNLGWKSTLSKDSFLQDGSGGYVISGSPANVVTRIANHWVKMLLIFTR